MSTTDYSKLDLLMETRYKEAVTNAIDDSNDGFNGDTFGDSSAFEQDFEFNSHSNQRQLDKQSEQSSGPYHGSDQEKHFVPALNNPFPLHPYSMDQSSVPSFNRPYYPGSYQNYPMQPIPYYNQYNNHANQVYQPNRYPYAINQYSGINQQFTSMTMAQLEAQQLQLSLEPSMKDEIPSISSADHHPQVIKVNASRPIVIKIDRKEANKLDLSSFPPLNSEEVPKRSVSKSITLTIPTKDVDKKSKSQLIYSTNRSHHNGQIDEQRSNYNRDSKPRYTGFNGLMTLFDKQTILKIQVSQLVTDDPLRDDYYYQMHKEIHQTSNDGTMKKKESSESTWKKALIVQSNKTEQIPSIVKSLRSQMQKLIEGKKKEKKATLSLVGALGKIALNSTKNPKQAIIFQPASVSSKISSTKVQIVLDYKLSPKSVLCLVEKVYDSVLDIESFNLSRSLLTDKDAPNLKEDESKLQDELWSLLQCDESISYSVQHPAPMLLQSSKGKHLITRLFKVLSDGRVTKLFTTILNRIECLDVCHVKLGHSSENVDKFMSLVIPSLIGIILRSSLSTVSSFLRILLERHNVHFLTNSKVGLSILTMILSRAEVLRQDSASEKEQSSWHELYNYLFQNLQGKFEIIFPSAGDRMVKDEVYAWQFLSSIAVGTTSIDHQRVLVTEVRDKAIETARRGDPKALANVDLFLSALELDIDATTLAQLSN